MKQALSGLIAMLFVHAGAVSAQVSPPLEQFAVPIYPKSGVYYDPTQSGTGLTIDTLAVGVQIYGFTTYYHYEPNGTPTWLNLIAPIVQTSFADYVQTGLPASIRGQWVHAAGGQCFDCAYTNIAVDTPPYGERVLNVLNGDVLQLPATGNASVRNMRIGKRIASSGPSSLSLLTNGAVWSLTRDRAGSILPGDGESMVGAWLIIKPRPNAEKLTFGANSRGVVEPAWLSVADKNTPTQYEFHKVFESTAGMSAEMLALLGANTFRFAEFKPQTDTDLGTLIVDAQSDRIRLYTRCTVPNVTPECPVGATRSNATIQGVADVMDAGHRLDGQDRIVIRNYRFGKFEPTPIWFDEIELTRVPDLIARTLAPNLPSGYAGKP